MTTARAPLIEARNLRKYFRAGVGLPFLAPRAPVRAVDDVSFVIGAGETFGIVGESGCGKSTTAKLLLLLERPTAGTIHFQDFDIAVATKDELRRYRASVQAVFQDPWSSLNPRMRVRRIIAEPILLNEPHRKKEIPGVVADLLRQVGLEETMAGNFPHEFSGGQRQRVAIARALALRPQLIVLDEPVSALDVSIRAQIMNLLKEIQDRFGMSFLLIAHNLATVRYLAHRVAVMYLGQIVEQAEAEELFTRPLHPYTQALIAAARLLRPGEEPPPVLSGDIPSPSAPPPGCRFSTRCPKAFGRCFSEAPAPRELAPGHRAACHLY
ncbi:MAG: ATP-binding cassette domain-containing protein [Proteobacteria bacterium]|nr:ATP-binding cassette domain-containing protein [Pseudomonadota bacterium]